MTLNDNKIDYVHWDDPNELIGHLRLLEVSRQANHNAHDNDDYLLLKSFVKLILL